MIEMGRFLARVREITGRSFAERDLVVLEREGFTLVVLADDLMAYVPSNGAWRRLLAAERRALARVAPRVSFGVPRPVGPIDAMPDLRVPARGMTGSAHHHRLMRDPSLAARAAEWMGKTLAELHGSMARIELDGIDMPGRRSPVPRLSHPDLRRIARDYLEGAMSDAAHAVIERWIARPPRTVAEDVFVHGDFGSHNFAFDEKSGMPVGVFDFHESGRGPRVVDFARLPAYGEDVLARAVAAYGREAPSEEDIRLAHAVSEIAHLSTQSSSVASVKTAIERAGISIL